MAETQLIERFNPRMSLSYGTGRSSFQCECDKPIISAPRAMLNKKTGSETQSTIPKEESKNSTKKQKEKQRGTTSKQFKTMMYAAKVHSKMT